MNRSLIAVLCGLALTAAAFPGVASADEADRRTIITFSGPVEIPGRVLPAGKYEFRLVDSSDTQNVVQISTADGKQVIATLLTIPTYRTRTPGKTIVTFSRRAPGAPEAIRAWFYPGIDDGEEFVYPKTRAVAIAQVAQEPVKTTPDTNAAHMTASEPAAQAAAVQALQEAPVQVAQPTGATVEIVEIDEVVLLPETLPHTASRVPSVLVAGCLLLLLGGAVRFARLRSMRAE